MVPQEFGLRYWSATVARAEVWASIRRSLSLATPVTLLSVLFCLPDAFAFARLEFPGRNLLFFSFLTDEAFPKFRLHLRGGDGAPIHDKVMVLNDLAEMIQREGAHPDAILQLDYKEDAAALTPRVVHGGQETAAVSRRRAECPAVGQRLISLYIIMLRGVINPTLTFVRWCGGVCARRQGQDVSGPNCTVGAGRAGEGRSQLASVKITAKSLSNLW